MNKVKNSIRSFGMSGLLICEELRQIESSFGIQLGHLGKTQATSSTEYYPQFEKSVRLEAAEMSGNYELFYCLEQSVRKLITEALQDAEGHDWWNSDRISPEIKEKVSGLVSREHDNGITQRSENMIDYTTFGQLKGIITLNWDIFQPTFKSKSGIERVLASLNLLRGCVAHCCPMQEDEEDRLRLAVKDWFRAIG